jgi:hypothetical protein
MLDEKFPRCDASPWKAFALAKDASERSSRYAIASFMKEKKTHELKIFWFEIKIFLFP